MKTENKKVAEAFRLLQDGNQRFRQGLRSIDTPVGTLRLPELVEKGQHPFAVIITCSDSRVLAETIFDRGVGDLFVIRVAGNVITPEVIASVEFAATKLGTSLALIIGHSRCGAVEAALETRNRTPLSPHSYLRELLNLIEPCFPEGANHLSSRETIEEAALSNVRRGVTLLMEKSETLRGLQQTGKFEVLGAYYDLATGQVHFGLEKKERNWAQCVPFKSDSGKIPSDRTFSQAGSFLS